MCEEQRAKIATLIVEAIRRNKEKVVKATLDTKAMETETKNANATEANDES
ncbi:hypothetical protein [Novipirellula artificiosorum]|uniref:hypothetical protein n=1 Tax=Novipirellula artificiosorum TaxID=2528016 RepID=UPI0018CE9007|nr:hypothetical protein [Novipirellula artificiosorum]